jgi:hypothetical protein
VCRRGVRMSRDASNHCRRSVHLCRRSVHLCRRCVHLCRRCVHHRRHSVHHRRRRVHHRCASVQEGRRLGNEGRRSSNRCRSAVNPVRPAVQLHGWPRHCHNCSGNQLPKFGNQQEYFFDFRCLATDDFNMGEYLIPSIRNLFHCGCRQLAGAAPSNW